jgi:hypothetical protein
MARQPTWRMINNANVFLYNLLVPQKNLRPEGLSYRRTAEMF